MQVIFVSLVGNIHLLLSTLCISGLASDVSLGPLKCFIPILGTSGISLEYIVCILKWKNPFQYQFLEMSTLNYLYFPYNFSINCPLLTISFWSYIFLKNPNLLLSISFIPLQAKILFSFCLKPPDIFPVNHSSYHPYILSASKYPFPSAF